MFKNNSILLTMTKIQEELDKNNSSLYNKRLESLPNDINEFSLSLEKYGLHTESPFNLSLKDIITNSKDNKVLYDKMIDSRKESKLNDYRFKEFESVINVWSDEKIANTEKLESLKQELEKSYTYKLNDSSVFDKHTSKQLIEEITNLELFINKSWNVRTKFNDDKYITNCNCTLLENSYTSNRDLIYFNRTRNIGQIIELITSEKLKNISKESRPQIYNTSDGIRPNNQSYYTWNGMQVFDLDLKNSPNFSSIKDFEKLKEQMFDTLKHYKWIVGIGLSSSGKGIHIYTKIAKPHLITLDNNLNDRISKFWFRYSYLQKYAAIRYTLTKICGIKESSDSKHKVIDFSLAKLSHGVKVSYDSNFCINKGFEDLHPQVGYHIPPVENLKLEDWILSKEVLEEKTFKNWDLEHKGWLNPENEINTNKELDFIIDEDSIASIKPFDGDIFYQLRYNVCNTVADMFGESGRNMVHTILKSDQCRNRAEIENMFNCAITTHKKSTKYGVSVLRRCGLKIKLSDDSQKELEKSFKNDVKSLIIKATEIDNQEKYNYEKVLNNNQYLGMVSDSIVNNLKNGKANLLISPPGVGKTEFIKQLAKTKRVLLVLPYISVIDSKIVNDKDINELFDVYQGSTSVDGLRKGRSAVMTIDKFSNISPEVIAYMFDIIAIDESHLMFTSSFRIEAMSNALKNIKEFISIGVFDEYSAKILCMTGTPTGETIYFDFYDCSNTLNIKKNESRTKNIKFVLCESDDEKIARIAMHIAKSLKEGKKILYPTNAGDVQAIKLIGMIEYEMGRSVKWGYYKKSNSNSEMSQAINTEATIKDYEVVLASNYLSVGIDINDITDFECVYDDSFAAFEIEQFNCRLRKIDIHSTIYISINDKEGNPKESLLNLNSFSIKMNREDRNLVRDYVDISNKKMELSMDFDPITNRMFTPGFRIENGQLIFKLEEHELTLFEERYLDTMRSPYFISKEMAEYGYKISIEEPSMLIEDHIDNLISIGLENARIESEVRNEKLINITNWMFDNDYYKTSLGGEIDGLVNRIWKENILLEEDVSLKTPEVVETFLGDIEKIKVPSRRIFDEQLKIASKLLSVYSVDTSKFLFSECISSGGKINKSEVNRYLKLLSFIKAEERGTLGKQIHKIIDLIHDKVREDFDQYSGFDSLGYETFIDSLTQTYLEELGLNLRTTKMLTKYRSEVNELVNTFTEKKRRDKLIYLSFRIIPTPDGKYVSKIEEYDATIVQMFQLSDKQLPEDLQRRIRLSHIDDNTRNSADFVHILKKGTEEERMKLIDDINPF